MAKNTRRASSSTTPAPFDMEQATWGPTSQPRGNAAAAADLQGQDDAGTGHGDPLLRAMMDMKLEGMSPPLPVSSAVGDPVQDIAGDPDVAQLQELMAQGNPVQNTLAPLTPQPDAVGSVADGFSSGFTTWLEELVGSPIGETLMAPVSGSEPYMGATISSATWTDNPVKPRDLMRELKIMTGPIWGATALHYTGNPDFAEMCNGFFDVLGGDAQTRNVAPSVVNGP